MKTVDEIIIPADVPHGHHHTYLENYRTVTKNTGRLFLFAGDQKVEHLNNDFVGEGIPSDITDPKHLFEIAAHASIGAFASQLGLIARYGQRFPKVPYIIKMNSKTNLVPTSQKDPISAAWYGVDDILIFRKTSDLHIVGIGYTVYFGSEYESEMLREAAQLIFHAHQEGLLAIIWAYPRGRAVLYERDAHIIAGAAGVAAALGADFVKVNTPDSSVEDLKEAVGAAGRTKLICAGGSSIDSQEFLRRVRDQIQIGGTSGIAVGRNAYQKPLVEAIAFCNAISKIVYSEKPRTFSPLNWLRFDRKNG